MLKLENERKARRWIGKGEEDGEGLKRGESGGNEGVKRKAPKLTEVCEEDGAEEMKETKKQQQRATKDSKDEEDEREELRRSGAGRESDGGKGGDEKDAPPVFLRGLETSFIAKVDQFLEQEKSDAESENDDNDDNDDNGGKLLNSHSFFRFT